IAPPERRARERRGDQLLHVLFRQVCRHTDVALRRRHQRAGISACQSLAPQIAEEGADRSQLARSGRSRVPQAVELGEKSTDGSAIELRRIEVRRPHAAGCSRAIEKLREVAFVGADGVRRRVAVEPKKLEKGLQMSVHYVRAVIAAVSSDTES